MKTRARSMRLLLSTGMAGALVLSGLAVAQIAIAAGPQGVDLGTASSFAVLAGTPAVTSTGLTTVNGDLGIHPAVAVTGFPPGIVTGSIHAGDAVALQAKNDLAAAYGDAAGRAPATVVAGGALGGRTLVAGVYASGGATLGLVGTLTLDGQNDPASVWIFQASSDLITASSSSVRFINGGTPCNVFWQVTSSATLGSGSTFAGSILALTSVTMDSGVFLNGRALARNGTVTLIDDAIDVSPCGAPTPAPTPTGTPAPTPRAGAVRPPFPPTPPPVPRALATPIPTASPTPVPTASPTPVPTASPTPVTTATVEEVIGSTAPTERSTPPPTSTLPTTGSSRNAGVPALLLAGSLLFLFGAMASRRPKARRTTTPAGRR